MIQENRTVYKCEYCRKMYQVKRFCERHELLCSKNSDNERPCFGCKFFEEREEEIYSGVGNPYGDEGTRFVKVFFCNKKDTFIYPPKVAVKGNQFDMGDKSNEEMPKECDLFVNNYSEF